MKRLESRKIYYGFPVYVLTYRDPTAASGWSMSTGSSSYSLGWTAVFGVWGKTNGASRIKEAGECTLSLVTRELMPIAERLGSTRGIDVHDKIERCGAQLASLPDESPHVEDSSHRPSEPLHYLAGSPLVLDLEVVSRAEIDGYANFVTRVRSRHAAANIVDEHGHLIDELLAPVNFVGDIARNIYRFPSNEVKELGDFLK
jgi:flavin reductase (DIM6/NTAB) family NADH-FMN oxidoreductase RutF